MCLACGIERRSASGPVASPAPAGGPTPAWSVRHQIIQRSHQIPPLGVHLQRFFNIRCAIQELQRLFSGPPATPCWHLIPFPRIITIEICDDLRCSFTLHDDNDLSKMVIRRPDEHSQCISKVLNNCATP